MPQSFKFAPYSRNGFRFSDEQQRRIRWSFQQPPQSKAPPKQIGFVEVFCRKNPFYIDQHAVDARFIEGQDSFHAQLFEFLMSYCDNHTVGICDLIKGLQRDPIFETGYG